MGNLQDPVSRQPEGFLKGRALKFGNRISPWLERIRSWKGPGIGTLFLLSFLAGLIFIGAMVYMPMGGGGGDEAVVEKDHSPFSPELREGRDLGPSGDLSGTENPPRLALVIDDLGYEPARDAAWLDLPAKITLAVLPFGPSSRRVAESGHERGFCVLLHAPMEPEGRVSDRTETFRFRRGMSESEMEELLDRMLRDVPFAAGVSNHMGSAFTADPEAMSRFTSVLKKHGLFLFDSVTSPRSVAVASALRTGIPVVRRDLFLDVDPDPDALRRQWEEALSIAKKKGSVIVICHGRTASLLAIRRYLPDLAAQGIRSVTLADLLGGGK